VSKLEKEYCEQKWKLQREQKELLTSKIISMDELAEEKADNDLLWIQCREKDKWITDMKKEITKLGEQIKI